MICDDSLNAASIRRRSSLVSSLPLLGLASPGLVCLTARVSCRHRRQARTDNSYHRGNLRDTEAVIGQQKASTTATRLVLATAAMPLKDVDFMLIEALAACKHARFQGHQGAPDLVRRPFVLLQRQFQQAPLSVAPCCTPTPVYACGHCMEWKQGVRRAETRAGCHHKGAGEVAVPATETTDAAEYERPKAINIQCPGREL